MSKPTYSSVIKTTAKNGLPYENQSTTSNGVQASSRGTTKDLSKTATSTVQTLKPVKSPLDPKALLLENQKLTRRLSLWHQECIIAKKKLNLANADNQKLKLRISHFKRNNVNLKEKLVVFEQSELHIQAAIIEHLTYIIKRMKE